MAFIFYSYLLKIELVHQQKAADGVSKSTSLGVGQRPERQRQRALGSGHSSAVTRGVP